jgi:hypothetical protein
MNGISRSMIIIHVTAGLKWPPETCPNAANNAPYANICTNACEITPPIGSGSPATVCARNYTLSTHGGKYNQNTAKHKNDPHIHRDRNLKYEKRKQERAEKLGKRHSHPRFAAANGGRLFGERIALHGLDMMQRRTVLFVGHVLIDVRVIIIVVIKAVYTQRNQELRKRGIVRFDGPDFFFVAAAVAAGVVVAVLVGQVKQYMDNKNG